MSGPILITGADSALGLAIMNSLAAPGETFIAHYGFTRDGLAAFAEEHPECRVIPLAADFRFENQTRALASTIVADHEPPNRFIHLPARRPELTRFRDLDYSIVAEDFEIQFRSAWILAQAILPRLVKTKMPGRIIFMLTAYTLGVPPSGLAGYVAAKHALLGLMKALAAEYANKKITINAVSPSMMETPFLEKIPEHVLVTAAERSPMKRHARPEEIAPAVKYLLSPEAALLTGVNLPITAGTAF
jgi:3-oxoacyl-[acyl-carrier protein] reductase